MEDRVNRQSMRNGFIGVLWCLVITTISAQPLSNDWAIPVAGTSYEQTNTLDQAPCGDLYMGGFFQDQLGTMASVGSEDGFIIKYNPQGQILWEKQIAATGTDRVTGIAVADDNTIYVVGEFRGVYYYNTDSLVSQDQLDVFVLKLDSTGGIQWAIGGHGAGYQSASDVTVLPNGMLSLTGYFEQTITFGNVNITSLGLRDAFVATIDANGVPQWGQTMGGSGFDEGRTITADSANNVYAAGVFRDGVFLPNDTILGIGGYDVFVMKCTPQGLITWVNVMGGPAADDVKDITVDNQQNPYVVGWFDRWLQCGTLLVNGEMEEDGYIVKYDPQGNPLWGKAVAGTFDERLYGIDIDVDNNIYILGTLDSLLVLGNDVLTNRHLNRPTNIFVAKYSADQTYRWAQAFGYYYNDFCSDLIVESATSLYIAGSFQDTAIFDGNSIFSQADYDVFLSRFIIDTTVAVQKIPSSVVDDNLIKVTFYPNPCHWEGRLEYELTTATKVNVILYDQLGRPLKQFLNKEKAKGKHQLVVNRGEDWLAEMYFLKVETNQTAYWVKIVLK